MTEKESFADIVKTNDDILELPTKEGNVPNKDPRQAIYEAYSRRNETQAEEKQVDEKQVEEEIELELAHEEELDTEPEPDVEPEELVTVKIYGEERTVPKTEVDAAGSVELYQIKVATEEQLDKAKQERAALKAEYEKLEQAKKEWDEQHNAKEEPKKPEKEEQAVEVKSLLTDLNKQYRDALYNEEDDEKAAEILLKIDEVRNSTHQQEQPQFDIDGIVSDKLNSHYRELDRQAGTDWFNREHAELANDPNLRTIVDLKVRNKEQENPSVPVSSIIQEVATEVSEWFSGKTTPAQQTSERVRKKREMREPQAASARQPARPAPQPKTRRDIVADIRKSRGLEI